MLLSKYQVESEAEDFALYVVKETGGEKKRNSTLFPEHFFLKKIKLSERRLVRDHEFPLRLRVDLGPREDIAKLFLMDRRNTTEIRHEVAQYLR